MNTILDEKRAEIRERRRKERRRGKRRRRGWRGEERMERGELTRQVRVLTHMGCIFTCSHCDLCVSV